MSCYCTFFDRGYLLQGLTLWYSLRRHEPQAELWVLALDEETAALLASLAGPGVHLLSLSELLEADPQLAATRESRSRAEFVFTLKPCLCRYLLREKSGGGILTYLDSDLYFFSAPAAIRRELGERSVLLVPHRYPRWHDDSARCGHFNAGLLAFRDNPTARACVDRWREKCLESCALVGGVSYGDQKYLDEWPDRFGADVLVSKHPGLNLAPWNWASHACRVDASGVRVDGESLVAFHFAQFRQVSGRWFDSGQLEYGIMPMRLRSRIYGEYWSALLEAKATIDTIRPGFLSARRGWTAALGPWHVALLRLFWGQFWVKVGPWWLAGRLGIGTLSGRMMGIYRRTRRPHA